MKIALVTNAFPSVSETFIYNHAAGLRAAGLDVTVIAARPSRDGHMFSDFDGLKYDGPIVQAILSGSAGTSLGRLAGHLSGAGARDIALWQRARKLYGLNRRAFRAWLLAMPLAGFDIVHFEYSGLAIAWIDALPLLAGSRLVTSCRGAAEQITPLAVPERAGALRKIFGIVDRVHCVSEDMRTTCLRYGLELDRAFINRPAIDISRFKRSTPYVARTAGPYRLLSTGRLHWKKGVEFALIAVRALVDQGLDVQYEIIGAGHDEEHLRFSADDLRLNDHVVFAGKRSSTEVRAALERCDVYLLPSLSEGLSNAALEAMAMELPVVTTTAGGMAEAITDGVDGIIVPPRAPDRMAAAVSALLADGPRRVAMGRAARGRLEEAFTLERQIRVYLAEYDVLGRSPPRASGSC
ncbi:MAG: glycosyltransferase family 4 protein [Deltaproteobacteria bacterium]|nr:glycosyltransferase family 4 protein [Deltaproteobacteria bacterium]